MRIIKFGGIANMGKRLAIRGHDTRGDEVIELLEMLGGSNIYNLLGNNSYMYYANDIRQNIIRGSKDMFDEDIQFFNLEEFLEKYPYKIRDKVIDDSGESGIIIEMKWDEEIIYKVDFGTECYYFTSDFLRPYKEANANELKPTDNVDDVHYISEYKTIGQGTYAIKIADGYKFDSVDENGNIIVKAFKPKPTYPANYDECKVVLQLQDSKIQARCGYEWRLISYFQQLLMCRDAYWKVAGEQMGLDGAWEPDWNDHNQPKFGIHNVQNNIRPIALHVLKNLILVFPTEEMRDTFYKNFDYLIEACKELL